MDTSITVRRTHVMLLAMLAVAGSCGDSPTNPPTPPPPPDHVGDFPVGDYTTEREPGSVLPGVVGTWDISFRANASGSAELDGLTVASFTYRVTGNEIRLTDAGGPGTCREGEESGMYRWSTEGTTLSFTSISDDCASRVDVLAEGPWTMN